jgi:hypothetical protein
MADNNIYIKVGDVKLWRKFAEELQNESSDRAKAIIGAAFLDTLLKHLFSAFMYGDKKNEMLKSGPGPLGSFYARILAAYHFGLITNEEKHDLDIIRKIRNDFAHDLGVVFEQQSIRDRCAKFRINPRFHKEHGLESTDNPERIYINEVAILATFINFRTRAIKQIKPPKELYFRIGNNVTIDPG